MKPIYIAGATRSAIGKFGGSLKDLTLPEYAAPVVREALRRANVLPEQVDELIFGNARQAGGGPNVGRQVAFRAGIPVTSPAYTVNQACASGLKSIILAAQEIALGQAECIVAGGGETMSRLPYYVESARWGSRLGHTQLVDGMYKDGFLCPLSGMIMGETAEKLAQQMNISRREQDEFALMSQERGAAAIASGIFKDEIYPVELKDRKGNIVPFTLDEHARSKTVIGDLEKLSPVFSKTGTVTAGNSSGITDGAAALVVMSEEMLKKTNAKAQARIVDYSIVGVEPSIMGIGPVPAVQKLLARNKITLEDIDLVELNEAFAAQVLACLRDLAIDRDKLNVNGGSISLGHPIGCTGTRIVVTLLHEMARRKSRLGLATLCVSGGMGIALLLERV
ncbi:MAG: thiolase family protein [Acidobacteria bacterium]|nr:thiolase family protein [Acidobacteriota bacterium]